MMGANYSHQFLSLTLQYAEYYIVKIINIALQILMDNPRNKI